MKNRVPEFLEAMYGEKKYIPSQDKLAKATGLSQTTISRWLSQKVDRFDAEALEKWARFFKRRAGDLIYIEGEDEWIQ